jgi:lysophospholipase L1-like esterase
MPARPRPVAVLALLWASLLFAPALTLMHSEYHASGRTPGWHFATLSPDGALFAWTRNRLAAWAALHAAGVALLAIGARRDPGGAKLRGAAGSRPYAVALGGATLLLLCSAAVLHPSEVMLVAMTLALGFLGLWVISPTAAALSGRLARLALSGSVGLAFACGGEAVMRSRALSEATGGSGEVRAARRDAWERALFPPEHVGPRWRSRHLGEPKPAGVRRVLALGDSFTFGDFIDDPGAIWTGVLEDRLAARGLAVEVINAASAGNDTGHEADVLEALGWALEPDLVVLQYTLNDAGEDPSERAVSLLPIVASSLRARSSLFHYLDVRFRAAQLAAAGAEGWSASFRDDAPGWRRSRAALERIARSASERGVPLVLLLFPMLDSPLDDARYRNLAAHEAIAAAARRLELPLVDVRRPLAELDPRPGAWWVRPFDAHPGPAAHRVAAEVLAAELSGRLGAAATRLPPAPERRRDAAPGAKR